ncbi:MAG: hypothetical protein AAB869_02995 [Patescibacteria group bacterium]
MSPKNITAWTWYYACMRKEDWIKVAKLTGYAYAPIALLIFVIFLLVQYQN